MQLTVMTFNLRTNTSADGENAWPYRWQRVANRIQRVAPAVVGVQEALYGMLGDLGGALPEYAWIGEGRDGGVAGEFCAVFYRPTQLQPVAAGHFWLSHRPQRAGSRVPETSLPRMCTWVRFRVLGTDDEFLFYNTHLDHRSQVAREIGAGVIVDHIEETWRTTPLPTFVVGDMNATPDNPAISTFLRGAQPQEGQDRPFLHDAFEWLRGQGHAVGATFHGFKGNTEGEPIDYIFHSPGMRIHEVRVESQACDDGRYPSDHFPVWATFEISDADQGVSL